VLMSQCGVFSVVAPICKAIQKHTIPWI
jgi:hypothetical protein